MESSQHKFNKNCLKFFFLSSKKIHSKTCLLLSILHSRSLCSSHSHSTKDILQQNIYIKNNWNNLKEERAHRSHFALLFDEDFEVLVDDCDGQQDSGAGSDRSHEIRQNGERSDAKSAECGRRRNVSVEFVDHGGLAMTSHHHLLLAKLLGDLKNCQ
jgi:hypothetical protein